MRALSLWFYQLPLSHVALLLLAAGLAFRYLEEDLGKHRQLHVFWSGLLLLWVGAVAYITLANRGGGAYGYEMLPFHSYREVLAGGNRELLRSNFMNVALFFPGGLLMGTLLPRKWPLWLRLLTVGTAMLALSAGVEYLQYARHLGRAEVDDLIHNTLGAIIGAAMTYRKK